ncbi:DUF2961 domain-containing protein [Dokdonella sp.]|uniref:DUF2961 domain-containing protein n=1 Tax=Dokdonella sp. TaxID=2291710 RepID=UPI001B2936A6|nr:DUF2961 domain-containing protein [Dokdonella sp.]MBO9663152.1 DUF2961 domain-containing protein [Dokdonella sp.]
MRKIGVAALLAFAAAARAGDLPWETWNDLGDVARVGGDYGSYLASSYCLDGCRYDRTSVDPGRGGPRFVRIESTAEGEQGVIFDQPGAGAVTRVWMTTGDGVSQPLPSDVRLRIYFDGEAAPTVDVPLDRFFDDPLARRGAAPLMTDRLQSSGGNVSYLPLPYRRGIKIALLNGTGLRLWYQINYTQVADATPVRSFAGAADFLTLAQRLEQPASADRAFAARLPFGRDRRPLDPFAEWNAAELGAGAPLVLLHRDGFGTITSTRIGIARERWDDVVLSIMVDGETAIELPIAEFFAADAADPMRPLGVFAGVDAGGAFYAALPMPYRRGIEVALRLREGADARTANVRSVFEVDTRAPPADAGTLRTYVHAACPTTPALGDEVLLEHRGSGRMVGLVAWMSGDGVREGGYYLEGDERVYVDGSVQPLWYGTGVEDLFNGGFYFDQSAYSGPLAGAPFRHAGRTDDAASMYRWFLTDAPHWRQSITYKLENGADGTEPMCLRSVAFYYARPEPAQEILATLQVGDAASEAAADYRRAGDADCAMLSARFGDEPPTGRTAAVCTGTTASRFTLTAPRAGGSFRLRRTFDAGVEGQAAEIWVDGVCVGAWPDTQANPSRRWSQMDVDFALPSAAQTLSFEIRPRAGRRVTESRYELFGAVARSGGD